VQRGSLKVNGRGRTRILGRYADRSCGGADAERKKILAVLKSGVKAASTTAVTLRR
jgi:hypothetical protein